MKNGLFFENGELIFYKKDHPYHAGVVKDGEDIYYISRKGKAVKGTYVVHGEMTNGILKRGTYTFGEDYKLIPGSYVAPSKRKRRSKLLKKWKKWVPSVCLGLVLVLMFLVAMRLERGNTEQVNYSPNKETTYATQNGLRLPTFEGKVLLCSDAAKQMYDGDLSVEDCVDAGPGYRALEFEYDLGDSEAMLLISEENDLASTRSFVLLPQYTSILVNNLKTDTAYRYEVQVDGAVYEGGFVTERSPRFLSIPGVTNTRDIGGYVTQDGKTVKQGLLIRGSEIDGLMMPSYFLEADAVEDVRETFGFAHEFDLRSGNVFTGVYQSRLGADVSHKFYGAPQYGEIFNQSYQPSLREIFTDLAKPENYPMYMHCTYGADRTGTIVFLLQGVLNMSENDMVREFRMTGFTTPSYRKSVKMDIVINGLQAYEGETLQEKIVTFLKEAVGITDEQIQSIRDIFLQ